MPLPKFGSRYQHKCLGWVHFINSGKVELNLLHANGCKLAAVSAVLIPELQLERDIRDKTR